MRYVYICLQRHSLATNQYHHHNSKIMAPKNFFDRTVIRQREASPPIDPVCHARRLVNYHLTYTTTIATLLSWVI